MDKLVFIIDDDQVYLKFMQTHFSQMGGYEVEVFSSGTEALKHLESKTPFMIILDHNLNDPKGDGLHYLSLIKKKKPTVPILCITSDATEVLRKKAVSLGAHNLIIKSDSFLVQLRTAIDQIGTPKKGGFFSKIFK
jgi:DNA-binding NtrC family response regulator